MGWDGNARCRSACYWRSEFGEWEWRIYNLWMLCHTEQELPGTETEPARIIYQFDGETFDRYIRLGHPEFRIADTEPWELPTFLRRIAGWLNSGEEFFLGPDEEEPDDIDDSELGAWLM